ncbi:hypothetical protein ACFQPG_08355 [Sphingomonas sp. GCM10030256]|uniref:hypothetical protein n=1 Tax=Sphingomonas sp. GCM10030256 TaxID=3273427 RepID=UPI00360C3521
MTMVKRLGRLFVIKTRWEAWLVIWAISLGAVERGRTYLDTYPGVTGWLFFLACTGVVFLAGAKLLDSVRVEPVKAAAAPRQAVPLRHAPRISRSRPSSFRRPAGSGSPVSYRRD